MGLWRLRRTQIPRDQRQATRLEYLEGWVGCFMSFHMLVNRMFSPLSCPNGESVEEMTARVDCVIGDVGSLIHYIEVGSVLITFHQGP